MTVTLILVRDPTVVQGKLLTFIVLTIGVIVPYIPNSRPFAGMTSVKDRVVGVVLGPVVDKFIVCPRHIVVLAGEALTPVGAALTLTE